jgi:two-component system sensor histidine kinase KdpD
MLITRVLVNLLDNAIKYSPTDAPVWVTARRMNGQVQIAVADQGPGIPPDDLARVFDKFYAIQRTDGVAGPGLGLTISRGIVEAHGGRIWAEARRGGGTILTFTLPVV